MTTSRPIHSAEYRLLILNSGRREELIPNGRRVLADIGGRNGSLLEDLLYGLQQ